MLDVAFLFWESISEKLSNWVELSVRRIIYTIYVYITHYTYIPGSI